MTARLLVSTPHDGIRYPEFHATFALCGSQDDPWAVCPEPTAVLFLFPSSCPDEPTYYLAPRCSAHAVTVRARLAAEHDQRACELSTIEPTE